MKFKIGDNIKVIKSLDGNGNSINNFNECGIIVHISDDPNSEFPISVRFKNNDMYSYIEDELDFINSIEDNNLEERISNLEKDMLYLKRLMINIEQSLRVFNNTK